MTSRSVPFEIPDINYGLVEVKGLLHFKNDKLILEFDQKDSFGGMTKSDVKAVEVPFSMVDSMKLHKKWFSTQIEILGKSMKIFEDVPGSNQGRILLKVKRKDRSHAESVISSARVRLSEYKLDELESED
ncbi:MAG: hypothetical protein R3283_07160 [Balneolaceae bacterium]|nr:hypothetical protein [Balneolaceae bacterium]